MGVTGRADTAGLKDGRLMEATLKLRMDQVDGEERGVTAPPFGVRAILRLAFSSNLQKPSPLLFSVNC
jgi:hypothetical protein